jgi:hypothetical protein
MLETSYGALETGRGTARNAEPVPNNPPSQYSRDPVDRLFVIGSDAAARMIQKRSVNF